MVGARLAIRTELSDPALVPMKLNWQSPLSV